MLLGIRNPIRLTRDSIYCDGFADASGLDLPWFSRMGSPACRSRASERKGWRMMPLVHQHLPRHPARDIASTAGVIESAPLRKLRLSSAGAAIIVSTR
jgi:hypothetical protein